MLCVSISCVNNRANAQLRLSRISRFECWFSSVSSNTAVSIFRVSPWNNSKPSMGLIPKSHSYIKLQPRKPKDNAAYGSMSVIVVLLIRNTSIRKRFVSAGYEHQNQWIIRNHNRIWETKQFSVRISVELPAVLTECLQTGNSCFLSSYNFLRNNGSLRMSFELFNLWSWKSVFNKLESSIWEL